MKETRESVPTIEYLGDDLIVIIGRQIAETRDLRTALEESVKLQSHYAHLLNMHDGGQRVGFTNADDWIARLRVTGTLPPHAPHEQRRTNDEK